MLAGLAEFREHLGGELTRDACCAGIGRAVEVHEIDRRARHRARARLAARPRGRRRDASPAGPAHLTYCTNIHPGETLGRGPRERSRGTCCGEGARAPPDRPFGVGLRLSDAAARQLDEPGRARRAPATSSSATASTSSPSTAFPYGALPRRPRSRSGSTGRTGSRTSASPTATAWRACSRRCFPTGVDGTVSTVPGCFAKPRPPAPTDARRSRASGCSRTRPRSARLREQTGRTIALALEPEPALPARDHRRDGRVLRGAACSARAAVARFAARDRPRPRGAAEAALRRHLGVCLDACHAAVEFEEPAGAVAAPARRPASASPRCRSAPACASPSRRAAALRGARALRRGRLPAPGGGPQRAGARAAIVDLPEALADARRRDPATSGACTSTCRSSARRCGPFRNTQAFLARAARAATARDPVSAASRGRDVHLGRAARGVPQRARRRMRSPASSLGPRGAAPRRRDATRRTALAARPRLQPAHGLDQRARRHARWRAARLGAVAAGRRWRPRSRSSTSAGMYLNDAFDRRCDARQRPERPIPSGRGRRRARCSRPASRCSRAGPAAASAVGLASSATAWATLAALCAGRADRRLRRLRTRAIRWRPC